MPPFNNWFPTSKYGAPVLNVKDFGALGDQAADDGPAIQAAFNAIKLPEHGGTGARALYFPPGVYLSNQVLYLIHTAGVRIFGDGPSNCIIAYRGTPGAGNIYGDPGIPATCTPTILQDGFSYSEMNGISLQNGTPGGTCMYIYQSTGQPRGITTGNMYSNMGFNGQSPSTGLRTGSTGLLIGWDALCSEQLFLNCIISSFVNYGISIIAFNALNINFIGCGGTDCAIWARCAAGAMNIIGASLAGNGLDVSGAGGMPILLQGIRTESPNFFQTGVEGTAHASIISCASTQIADGNFIDIAGGAQVVMQNCFTYVGGNISRLKGTADCSLTLLQNSFQVWADPPSNAKWDNFAAYEGWIEAMTFYDGIWATALKFSGLPVPHVRYTGIRTFITDSTVDGSNEIVSAGGGTKKVPIWCDGTNWRVLSGATTPVLDVYTVATLPASPVTGQRAVVTDASTTIFAETLVGGGGDVVPTTYNGTNWQVG